MAVAACLAMAARTAPAVDEAVAGREIINKWQNVIVTVKLIAKIRMVVEGKEMEKMENKVETVATVIDPSGLAVLSLTSISPGEAMNQMMQQFGRGSEAAKLQVESETTDVKMRLSDGQEVPAQVVLRDKDLDMAFVRPKEKPAKAVPALDLTKEAKPQILDQIVTLSRLGKVGSWATSAALSRIQAIIEKPRTFYVPNSANPFGEMGTPVFSLDGKVVGVLLLRMAPPEGGGGMAAMLGGTSGLGMLPVILPAADIREVAKQVPAK
jgi:hypothetical protein